MIARKTLGKARMKCESNYQSCAVLLTLCYRDAPDVIAEYWFKRKHTKQQYGDERFSKRQRLLAKSQNGASATTTKKGKTAHTKPAVKGSLAKRVTSKRGNSNNTAAALPPSPSTPKVGPRITFRGKRMKIADNSSSERNWKKDVVKIVKAKFLKDSGSAPIFLVVQWYVRIIFSLYQPANPKLFSLLS
jgi:hypothetical protein